METVKVSEILDLVKKIHKDAQTAIHYLEGRILIGEINRPDMPAEKKPRKKRTRKVKPVPDFQPPNTLPDADESNPFYGKKKREKKEPVVE